MADVSTSGSFNTAGNTSASLPLAGQTLCTITISGTGSVFTVLPQTSADNGATWQPLLSINGGFMDYNGSYSGALISVGLTNFRLYLQNIGVGTIDYGVICSGGAMTVAQPLSVLGTGTAGTPAPQTVTVQGIAGGTVIPVSGSVSSALPYSETADGQTATASSAIGLAALNGSGTIDRIKATTNALWVNLQNASIAVTGTFWQNTQPISGTVAVSNFPATQPVSGTVTANAGTGPFPVSYSSGTFPVSGTFWQATQPVSGTFWQTTQPVSGTFWQSTQPVSIASMPSTPVTGTFWQTTQPVSGTFWQATQPVSIATMPSTPVTGTFWQATQPVSGTFWQATQPVSIASMPSTPVTGTFWQATQPVSIASMPSTPVTGTFWQSTQPVSGTVAVSNLPATQPISHADPILSTTNVARVSLQGEQQMFDPIARETLALILSEMQVIALLLSEGFGIKGDLQLLRESVINDLVTKVA